jgi:hypothetical protein
MKLFIHHDEKGSIVSAVKVHEMNSALPHPFVHHEESNRVIEVEVTPELNSLHVHEVVEQYFVDHEGRLMKKEAGKAKKKGWKSGPDRMPKNAR